MPIIKGPLSLLSDSVQEFQVGGESVHIVHVDAYPTNMLFPRRTANEVVEVHVLSYFDPIVGGCFLIYLF